MTDDRILRRLREKSPEGLEALMEKYRPLARSIIAGILGAGGSAEDVEELTQDAFFAVWNHADAIRGNLKGYLSAAARNSAKSYLRKQRELPMDLDTLELKDPKSDLEDAAIRGELATAIRRAVDSLRPREREIFLRYYYHLQNSREIAAEMGLSISTVSSCLIRGRKRLEKILSKEDFL